MSQEREDAIASERDIAEASAYCKMAVRQADRRVPVLLLMHGLSGSGKTWVSEKLMAAMPAIRLRSDIERKRMVALHESASSDSDLGKGIYTKSLNHDVYAKLLALAQPVLGAGLSVILDATFLRESDRAAAMALAEKCGVRCSIIDVTAAPETMRRRINQRRATTIDASEADRDVLDFQIETAEPFSGAELAKTVSFVNSDAVEIEPILDRVRQLLD